MAPPMPCAFSKQSSGLAARPFQPLIGGNSVRLGSNACNRRENHGQSVHRFLGFLDRITPCPTDRFAFSRVRGYVPTACLPRL
jgi:hypothetical protein